MTRCSTPPRRVSPTLDAAEYNNFLSALADRDGGAGPSCRTRGLDRRARLRAARRCNTVDSTLELGKLSKPCEERVISPCFVSGVVTPPPLAAEIDFRSSASVQKPQIAPISPPPHDRKKSQKACLRLVICADAPRPSFVARRPRPRSKSPADEAASLLRRLVTPREHSEERLSPSEDDAGVLCSLDRLCRRLNAGYRRRLFDARVATASSQPPWGRLPRRRTA